MPNGGSDCCGTCSFNELKDAPEAKPRGPHKGRCVLRGLDVDSAFHYYCVNHPYHNTRDIREPIGPVYTADMTSFSYTRVPSTAAPDSPEIRTRLLDLLEGLPSGETRSLYPSRGIFFDAVVLNHLAELKERAALPRILRFLEAARERFLQNDSAIPKFRTACIIQAAIQASLVISEDKCLEDVEPWLQTGDLSKSICAPDQENMFAFIRMGLVKSLEHCSRSRADTLLLKVLTDPHPGVRKAVEDALDLRGW